MRQFGINLRAYLESNKISQREFAESCGYTHVTLNRVLNNTSGSTAAAGRIIATLAKDGDLNTARQLWEALREDFFDEHGIPHTVHTPTKIDHDPIFERLWSAINASAEENAWLVDSFLMLLWADTPNGRSAQIVEGYRDYTRTAAEDGATYKPGEED